MSITQARTLIVQHHKYAWVLTLVAVFIISGVYFREKITHAATYYFQQSSWSGGVSALTARHLYHQNSDWNTYDSASSTLVIGGNITLVPSTPWFTDDGTTSTNSGAASGGDFDNGDVSGGTAVSGSGTDASIILSFPGTKKVSTGENHTCALRTGGTVYCWGLNSSGQLGINSTTEKRTPVQVYGVNASGFLTGVIDIDVGANHSCAVKSDGTAYCWGLNASGQLGNNTTTSTSTPVQVLGSGGSGNLEGVSKISASGTGSTCAVKTNGSLWCWGYGFNGELGINTSGSNRTTPVQVLGIGGSGTLDNVSDVSAGWYHTCAVKSDSTAYCWGYNGQGQLGDGGVTARTSPVQVHGVADSGYLENVSQISAGGGYGNTCAVKTDGSAYCWGTNNSGQIGDNTTTNSLVPVQVHGVGDSGNLANVSQIETGRTTSNGNYHTCAVKTDGTVYCWGINSSGQLGINSTTLSKTPVQVLDVGGSGNLSGISQISIHNKYSCAVSNTGSVYCWGENTNGKLGDNTASQRNAPIKVHGVNDSGYFNILTYLTSGFFTSAVVNMGGLAGFTTIGYGSTVPANTTISVDVRAGNTSTPDGTWASWQTGLASGGSIELFSGKQYIQYRVNLTTSDTFVTPTFDYLTVNYTEYTPIGSLISSAYNSESDANVMSGLVWTEDATLPSGTTATFYLRTSATSDLSVSSWSTGITSGTDGCSKTGTTVTCIVDPNVESALKTALTALREGNNDQWFQYKLTLTSPGDDTPTIDDVRVAYVVNSPPTFDTTFNTTGVLATQNTTIGDADYGKVNISYRVGDLDTGSFTPSFKYSVNGGSTWSDISSNDLSADATALKTYTGGATTTFSVVWNATSTLSANPVNIANAKVRVTVNDGDVANNIATADSAVTTLDTTFPEITTGNFVVDSSVDGAGSAGTPGDNRAGIKLYATDYSTIQYRLCNNSAFPTTDSQGNSCAWSSLSASPISLATSSTQWITTGYPNAETVYMQVRDAYGNVTSGTASAPAMPANFDYKDVSNTTIDVYREFLSWSVFSATDSSTFTGNSSGRYKLYHATAADGSPEPASSSYSAVSSIADPTINYATHNITSATTSVHYYKAVAMNDQGSISDFTAVLSDIPNGSGGAVSLPPQITDTPTADNIKNTSARITFTSDMLATSTVEYGTTNSYGTTAYQTSFVENHSLYLNNLSPNTAYYFRAKATNAEGQDSDWAVGTTFNTAQGTVISGVTPMNVTDKTATIFWNTNASSTSKVYYGTDRSGSTLVGSVTVTGASATTAGTNGKYQHQVGIPSSGAFTAGNTYYYKVESTDGDNNTTTDDNNGQFYSFTTTLDTTAPTISDISAAVVGPTSAVIVWTTDEPATSQVRWSESTGNHSKRTTTDMTYAGIPSYSVYHVATLSSQTQNIGEGGGTNILVAETPYYYTVVSADAAGNETESEEQTFTTTRTGEDVIVTVSRSLPAGTTDGPTADTTSPVVTNMKVTDITPFTATVTFDTSEASVGKLGYSKDTSYGDHAADDFSWGTKHSIKLRGLTLGTQYHIKASVVDRAGNTGYSEEQTFKTSFLSENVKELSKIENIEQFQKEIEETIESILPSLIPPFVSKPTITDVTESGATISFRTNIKAFPLVGFVEDGTFDASKDNPYTSEVSDTTEKATNHTLALLNLKPNTKYHVQARAFSLPQVVGKSEDLTFTTQASRIQGSIVETKRDSFTVVWVTDEPTTSIVEYKDLSNGITQRKADERKTTSHSMKIENLSSGTTFEVNISGLNEGGNLIEGGSTLRTTTSRDITPPAISNFKVSNAMVPGRTDRIQTIISWTTDEPADSVVYFEEGIGTAGAEEKELANKSEVLDAYVVDHNIIISSLKPGAIYRIKVTSVDESGNLGVFGPRTIITPKQTESITDIIFKNFEDSFKFLRDM